jgi:hypothetical protein
MLTNKDLHNHYQEQEQERLEQSGVSGGIDLELQKLNKCQN